MCGYIIKNTRNERKKLKDFEDGLETNPEIIELRKEVEDWSRKFGFPGI